MNNGIQFLHPNLHLIISLVVPLVIMYTQMMCVVMSQFLNQAPGSLKLFLWTSVCVRVCACVCLCVFVYVCMCMHGTSTGYYTG